MALRPTLDDGSSSDSSSGGSSDGSSSDERDVEPADSASLGMGPQHCNYEDVATDVSLPDANSTDAVQTAVAPNQWFWSAFISVERLPGVRFYEEKIFI